VLATGTVIGQRYRLEKALGKGGMGTVWSATHVVTRKVVALKFLQKAGPLPGVEGADESARRRILREARAVCAVNHPHVVEVHDVLELEDGSPVLVMDLLEGESLGERLQRERTLSVEDLLRIVVPMLSGLEAAHARGIVHRDVKPDNVFLARRGDGSVDVKLLDFGIAKVTKLDEGAPAESAQLTGTGAMMGTPYYMAPEQVYGERDLDARTDVWAVGISMYECLAGVRPADGANLGQILKQVTVGPFRPLSELAPKAPHALVRIIEGCLERDRTKRIANATKLREALERVAAASTLDGTEVAEERASAAAERWKPRRWVAAAVAVALGAGAVITVASVDRRTPPHSATAASPVSEIPTAIPAPMPAPIVEPSAPAAAASTAIDMKPAQAPTKRREPTRPPAVKTASPAASTGTDERAAGGVVAKPPF
jgi:serine/threonine-protein kinase